jgi:transcriptional regulator with XRE-family HTH domain
MNELSASNTLPHAVVNILHGRSKNPSLKTVHAIAQQLGCGVEELLNQPLSTPVTKQNSANSVWNADLYLETVKVLLESLKQHQMQPDLNWLHEAISEAYAYALGNPEQKCDSRFIRWLVEKKLKI